MIRLSPELGVVVPLPVEARCLGVTCQGADPEVRLNDSVLLRISGIGAARAGAAAVALLDQGARALASWGFAGALDPSLRPGVLVVAAEVRDQHGGHFIAHSDWRGSLHAALGTALTVSAGTLLSWPEVVREPAEKARLGRLHGAVAVDMESAAVATVAQRTGVPFVAVRGICDGAETDLPPAALAAIGTDGRMQPAQVLAGLARRPWETLAMVRLAMGARRARYALRAAARCVGSGLLAPGQADTGPASAASGTG